MSSFQICSSFVYVVTFRGQAIHITGVIRYIRNLKCILKGHIWNKYPSWLNRMDNTMQADAIYRILFLLIFITFASLIIVLQVLFILYDSTELCTNQNNFWFPLTYSKRFKETDVTGAFRSRSLFDSHLLQMLWSDV